MRVECIESLIACNREIEFTYLGSMYSITYFEENNKKYISVCEFYKKVINVQTVSDVLKIKIGLLTLKEIFAKLPDSAFDIY